MSRWDTTDYMRLQHVRGDASGTVEIRFADGSSVQVDGQRLAPTGVTDACWEQARPGEDGFEIVVPRREASDLYIPWDVVRSVTDPEFAAHMSRAAEEQARTVGERIRALRQARGLTAREVAARSGISPQSLYRIEHGKHDVVLTTLGRILAAMGYGYRDLTADG